MHQRKDFGVRTASGHNPLRVRHTYLNWLFPSSTILPTRTLPEPSLSAAQLLSVALVLVVLIVQFFRPSPDVSFIPFYNVPEADSVKFGTPYAYPNPLPFLEDFPTSRSHKMTLLEEAKRVAEEFDYPAKEVNKGVKEFIRQMSWFPGVLKLANRA